MAKTEYYYFQGKAKWAKVHQPDIEYKNWNICVYLTPESWNIWNKLKETDDKGVDGILNESKKDDDGEYVVFKRPMTRKWDGKDTMLAPPIVLDSNDEPTTLHIGNGSDVTVKVECYKYRKPFNKGFGRAIRLLAVKIENLVPFTKSHLSEDELRQMKGLPEVPKQKFYE